MYKIIKSVLEAGKFDLSDILTKIDTFWIRGGITDDEKSELIEIAQSKAKPENSVDFMKKIEELEQRIKTLEESNISEDATPDEYPEFAVSKWYYAGNKITFEGNKYECIAPEGVVCVWSPKDYPVYWQVINE